MSTRFKSNSKKNYNQSALTTGYENVAGAPDVVIPSCGIEDVDISIFNLFDKEIAAEYGGQDAAELKKVPVIFAAGEKWALLKKGRLLRDKTNTLVLPLITIMRTELNQSVSEDVVGRGINQQVGEIIVRRKLDKSDRDYQSLINKLFLNNVPETAVGKNAGQLQDAKPVRDGALLTPNLLNNVYETIVVPTPQFYTAKYQVTIWTQYTQHANQILEKMFNSFLPQGQSWRLDTSKGYWFVAKLSDGSFSTETNFDDMSQQERYIKHTFEVTVPAYFFANTSPGSPVAIKRYVSSTSINFDADIIDVSDASFNESEQYVLGSDDPTLPLDEQKNNRKDQRNVGWRQQKIYPVTSDLEDVVTLQNDPAAATIPKGYVKVISRTSKGETVFSGTSLGGLEIVVTK
jgi:hypothetical protein